MLICLEQTRLEQLSDTELLRELKSLADTERTTTLAVLLHLTEIDTRRAYLALGYSSLFDYCTRSLGYSESAASRRIRSARCVRDFPEVYARLEANEITISTLSMIAGVLSAENSRELLFKISCRSQREVETILSAYRPGPSVRDRVTPVAVGHSRAQSDLFSPGLFDAAPEDAPGVGGDEGTAGDDGVEVTPKTFGTRERAGSGSGSQWTSLWTAFCEANGNDPELVALATRWQVSDRRSGGRKVTTSEGDGGNGHTELDGDSSTGSDDVGIEQRYKLEFAVSAAFMEKLEKVKTLFSNRHPRGVTFERVFDVLMDAYLDRHSPQRRKERRERRHEKANDTPMDRFRPDTEETCSRVQTSPTRPEHCGTGRQHRSRHISAAVRDTVYTRDRGRCTYVGTDGIRCNATWDLEIDHIVPYARGGTHSADNLRLLCANHNRLAAENAFGRDLMRQYTRRE